jgi:tetratricopeptide (TPR) repeat protein
MSFSVRMRNRLLFLASLFSCVLAYPAEAQVVRDGSINLLPMYGGVRKSRALRKADERFLTSCDELFPNRQAAADYHANKGWEFIRKDDFNTAVKRFNQAWLLDSTNATAYWGFGAVAGARKEFTTSLHYFELTRKHDPTNLKVLLDISQTLLLRFELNKQPVDLDNALNSIQLFLNTSHDALGNFQAYEKIAIVYFLKRDYPNAWKYVDLAATLNPIAVQKWELLPELRQVAPQK